MTQVRLARGGRWPPTSGGLGQRDKGDGAGVA